MCEVVEKVLDVALVNKLGVSYLGLVLCPPDEKPGMVVVLLDYPRLDLCLQIELEPFQQPFP